MQAAKRLRAVGLFGGSFNPVHTGHLLLARHALEHLKLDEVWLIPCAASADRKVLAPARARLAWVRKAVRGEAGLKASAIEVRRGGVSRTIDTLRQVRKELGPGVRLTLLLGQDQVAKMGAWKEAAEIPPLAVCAAFSRPGYPRLVPKGFRIQWLKTPLYGISSSEIRLRIKQKKAVSLLLPSGLAKDRGLHQSFR